MNSCLLLFLYYSMDLDDDEEAVIRKAKALLAGTPPLQKENFENGTGCRDSMANGLTVDSIDDSAGGSGSAERSSIDVGNSNNQHTDFETMPREIVNSLREENQKLREALRQEKADLEDLTDQMTEILTTEQHSTKQTEDFLIATIKTGRKNHVSLENAHNNLIDAMTSRQNEIMRLCEEGMQVQSAYIQQIEKVRVTEQECQDIRRALEQHKRREEEMSSKLDEFRTLLEEKEEELLHFKSENSSRENLQSYMKDMVHSHEIEKKDLQHSLEINQKAMTSLEVSVEELREKLKESDALNKDMGSNLDECNEVIVGLEKERDEVKQELTAALKANNSADTEATSAQISKLQLELEAAREEIVNLNESLAQSLNQEALRASQIIASKEEVARIQTKLTDSMHSLGLRENEVVNNVKQIVELKDTVDELKKNEADYREKEQNFLNRNSDERSAIVEVERLNALNTEAQKKLLAYQVEVAELREANGTGSAEYSRVTALFDESQKLLMTRDSSLEEARKNIDTLRDEVKDLQIVLGKSEHMRLHNESIHESTKDEVDSLEIELQRAREGALEANVSMNHAQAALDVMTRRYDELNTQFKALTDEKNELRVELAGHRHDNEMLSKEMNHLHAQLENVGNLYEKDEMGVKGLRHQLHEAEERLKQVETRESEMRLRYEKDIEESRTNVDFLSKNSNKLEKELAQSEYQRLHHEGNSKSIQDELDTMELEVLQLREDKTNVNMALNRSTAECDSLRKSLEIAEIRFKEAEEERKCLNNSLHQIKDEHSAQNVNFIDSINDANARIAALTAELSMSKHELGSKSSNLIVVNKEIVNLQQLLLDSQHSVERLQQDNDKLREEMNGSVSPLGELERVRHELVEREKLYFSQQSSLEEMELVHNGLQGELREANTKVEILNREIANLTKVMEKKENSLVKLRDANNKGSAEYGRISALYDESQKLAIARDKSLGEANKSIETSKEQNQKLQIELNKSEHSMQCQQDELSSISTKLAALETELVEQMASVAKSSVEISYLKETKTSLETTIEDLRVQLTRCQEKLMADVDSVHAAKSANDLLQENAKQLNCQLQASQGALDATVEELKQSKEEIMQLKGEARLMTTEMEKLRTDYSSLKDELDSSSKNSNKLEKELAQSEYQRLHHEGNSKSIQDELDTMELEVLQLREDITKAKICESNSSTSLSIAEEKIARLEVELKESWTEVQRVKDECTSETSPLLIGLRDDLMKVSTDLTASREVLGIRVGELNASRTDVENLRKMLGEAQKDASRLVSEKEKALLELATLKATSSFESPLQAEIDALKKDVTRLEVFCSSQSKTIEEMERVECGLEDELKAAQQELKDVREANSKGMIEYTRLSATNDESVRMIASKEEALVEVEKVVTDANKQIDSLKAELSDLRLKSVELTHVRDEVQRLQDVEKNLPVLTEEVYELKTCNDLLNRDLQHAQEQMTSFRERANLCQIEVEKERERNSSLMDEIKGLREEIHAQLNTSSESKLETKDLREKYDLENNKLHEMLDRSRADYERMNLEYMDKYKAMQEDTYKLAVQLSQQPVPEVEEINRYKALLLDKDTAIERLTDKCEGVQSELCHCEELRSALEQGQRAITEELSALTTKTEMLEKEIKVKDDLLKSQSNVLDENEDVIAQLEKEINTYKENVEKVQEQLVTVETENEHLQQALGNSEAIKRELLVLRQSLKVLQIEKMNQRQDSNKKLTCIQNELLQIANSEANVSIDVDLVNEYTRVKDIYSKKNIWNLGIEAVTTYTDDGGMPSPEATNDYQPKVSSVVDKFEAKSHSLSSSQLKSPKKNPFSL